MIYMSLVLNGYNHLNVSCDITVTDPRMSIPDTPDQFAQLYETYLRDPISHRRSDRTLYDMGVRLVRAHLSDEALCESVLSRLIFLYPTETDLAYYMAWVVMTHHPTDYPRYSHWFQTAFRTYHTRERWDPAHFSTLDPLETLLDLMKVLFDRGYIEYIQYLFDTYHTVFMQYVGTSDPRWLLFLGAYYIRTHQLQRADDIYTRLLTLCDLHLGDGAPTATPLPPDLQYQILNNALILYMRMAKFEWIHRLLERNFVICHAMEEHPLVTTKTKANLFASNMLIYDYLYHLAEERQQMNSYVQMYFPSFPAFAWGAGEHERWHRRLGWVQTGTAGLPALEGRVHIGYVSSDFIHHVVANFILPIVDHHDRTRFKVTLFVTRNYEEILATESYRTLRNRVELVCLQDLGAREAADRVRERGVDILVDLNGYTEHHRLDVFAQRPAPIQVAYLGYPNTVGSTNIVQYRITDRVADPPGSTQWFAEKRVYVPGCFLLFRSVFQGGSGAWIRRAPLNIDDPLGTVVLGSLNRESKNSPEVLACWRRILERAPHTILLIKLSTTDDDDCHMARYYQEFGVGMTPGITPDRIRFAHYGSNQAYFELLGQMDILLDTFPYSGTTTTCNALYNSVPVVTMSHPHLHAHNVSTSLLTHVGAPEMVATTPEAYVETVVALADDPDRLTQYRSGALHRQFCQAMNPATFIPRYEETILSMVRDQFA